MSVKLVLNPITCVGHGLCAELFPERISLDPWGYPIIDPRPIPAHLEGHARKAAVGLPDAGPAPDRARGRGGGAHVLHPEGRRR